MKYYHVIRKRNNRALGFTLAVQEPHETDQDSLKCAVAYCAPLERNFSRPLGRTIAAGRFASDKDIPTHMRFRFYAPAKGESLKIHALKQLGLITPIAWVRAVVDDEIANITKRRMERWLRGVEKYNSAKQECPVRLVAKKVRRRARSGITQRIDAAIIAYLRQNPGVTGKQVLEHLETQGLNIPKASCQLTHLVRAGSVRRQGRGGRNDVFRYHIVSGNRPSGG